LPSTHFDSYVVLIRVLGGRMGADSRRVSESVIHAVDSGHSADGALRLGLVRVRTVNEEANEIESIDPIEVEKMVDDGAQLVDVRTDHEWEAGHLAGAVHIRFEELSAHAEELDKERPLVLYCRGGNRSGVAAAALRGAGYDAHHMAGGITAWAEAERPLEPPEGYVAESGEAAAVLEARRREAAPD